MRRKVNLRNEAPTKTPDWHDKIAKARGPEWRKNIMLGRKRVNLNPSKIRILRLKAMLDQDVVAGKLGLTASSYGEIERARRFVDKSRAELISKFYKVKTSQIFKPLKREKFVALF